MPPPRREWLPSCFDSPTVTSSTSSTKKPGYVTRATSRIDGVIAPAREQAQTASGADTCCPHLTFRERVQGCLACFGIGMVISFLSFLSWWSGQTATFAIFYTFGNIVAICGSGFLIGPKRQFRNMTRAKRIWATAIYATFMILTLTFACMDAPSFIVLFCVFCRNAARPDRNLSAAWPRRHLRQPSAACSTCALHGALLCDHASSPRAQNGVHWFGTLHPTFRMVRARVWRRHFTSSKAALPLLTGMRDPCCSPWLAGQKLIKKMCVKVSEF